MKIKNSKKDVDSIELFTSHFYPLGIKLQQSQLSLYLYKTTPMQLLHIEEGKEERCIKLHNKYIFRASDNDVGVVLNIKGR